MTQGAFEAKKHAYRQTQDGIVVSFVIHPNDVDAVFAVAPLGTRYMVGFAEIGEDDKPSEPEASNCKPDLKAPGDNLAKQALSGGEQPDGSYKEPRRPFASLPLSQQAAIRCGDVDFQKFMVERYAGPHPFRASADNAAIMVREACGIASRSEILRGTASELLWESIEEKYQAWLTTQRYASVAR